MATYTAVLDACILYQATLRNLLMWMAVNDVYRAKWTEEIQNEWVKSLLENRPDLTAEKLARTRSLMNEHVRDSIVEGYEYLIDGLELPDPDDRHVLAAAIHGRADAIITANKKDFPEDKLEPYGIEVIGPDEFISFQFDIMQPVMAKAIREHRDSLNNPPMSNEEYLAGLERNGLVFTVYEIKNRGLLQLG